MSAHVIYRTAEGRERIRAVATDHFEAPSATRTLFVDAPETCDTFLIPAGGSLVFEAMEEESEMERARR